MAGVVIQKCIRRHFAIALTSCPVLPGFQQRSTVTMSANIFIDVPRFHISDRTGVTPVGVRTRAGFDKARERSVVAIYYEHFRVGPSSKFLHPLGQVFRRVFREQSDAHSEPFIPVGITIGSDRRHRASTSSARSTGQWRTANRYRAVARWMFQPVTTTLGDAPPRSRML